MIRVLALMVAAAVSAPALAQHEGLAEPAHQPADPHAGHHMPAQTAPEDHGAAHNGHGAPSFPAPAHDPHAGHAAGTHQEPGNPRDGHPVTSPSAPPVAPPPPEALRGPDHAADLVHGREAMEGSRQELAAGHGGMTSHKLLLDRLEAQLHDGKDGYAWSADFWYGGDTDRLWIKSEGGGALGGDLDSVEVQGLWSHAIDPWFDLQVGVRQDFAAGPDRTHLVLGMEGLAPYWFDVEAAAFLSSKGDLTVRMEGDYDLRITQKLIFQPRAEVNLAAQDVPELSIGSGFSTAEIGARLRYELQPRFAPYVGIEYQRAFGDTREFRRARGDDEGGWSFLAGLRGWF